MAESISDFIRKQAQQQQLNTVGAASIVLDTVEQKPDEVAGALNLADEYASETGGPRPPVEFVQEYGNVLKKEIERKRTGTILSGAPKLADWVRDPVNAALAKDAIKELSWFEGFTRGTANTAERAGERLDIGYNQFMLEQTAGRARDREMSFSDILKEERTSTRFKDEQGNPIETWDGSEYISAFARWVDARYADLIGTDDKAAAEEYARALGEAQERLKAIPKSQVATEFENDAMVEGASLGESLVNLGAAFIRNPVGGLSWALETAGESAPQIIAGAVTTAVTRNPAAGIAVTGTGSYLTERYTSPAEFFEEKGIDLSKSEDIQRLISDPALMKEAAERGVIRGLVIGAFDALSMGIAGRSLAGNPLLEAMAQTAQQMVLGAGGEYTARLAAGQEIDWNEVIAEGFAEGATAVVDMGIAGRKLIRQRSEAREAAETQKKVEELLANAGQNPLRARMPAKFQEFLERATAGTNVENVFVDSQKFVEFFQGLGVDPFEIADTLEGVGAEELRMASLSGGDVKIPVATLATTVPGSGFEDFFIQEARFDPDTMSPSQAAEFNARVDELRAEAFEMAEQLRQEEERARTREQEIYETIVSEMRAAGQSNIVARYAAMVWLANYRTAAADEGVTLDEYLERYPLPKVRGTRPEGIVPKNVDELTRTLAEARSRKKTGQVKRGPSLLEFISEYGGIDDAGGELRARNAEIIKRGRGKKSLRLARGGLTAVKDMLGAKAAGKKFGPDDVARAVIEAGYLSDDPIVQEYRAAMEEGREVPDITRALWEGIDRELRGEALYAASSEPDADVVAREEMLDNLEQYLSELGVSLDDPDDVIREAVNRDMEERRSYASGALEQAIRGGFDMTAGGGVKTVKVGDTTLMYSIASDGKSVELFSVRTPASKRGKGSARSAIASFLLETDALGMEVKLSASPLDKKTKLGPLVEFYKSLGFEPTGRAINAAGDPEMVRKPQRSYNQQGRLNTESEAFKRWFGDSKVVDENGQPLVVYHGTVASFEGFDLGAASRTGHPSSGLGVFFTASPNVASMFARDWDDAAPFDTANKRPFAEGASIMPVYLSIKNPVTLSAREFRDLFVDRETYRLRDVEAFRKLREEYEAQGYDGVIIEASGEAVPSPGLEEYTARQFIAFEPTQIKSVNNRGTFDPNDARLLYQSDTGARGSIMFPSGGLRSGETIINLFERADMSTFLHESGHYFLESLRDRAALGSEVAQERMAVIRNWWRENARAVAADAKRASGLNVSEADVISWLDNGTTGNGDKDMAIDTGAHEQWARGFEAYLMEGKAPSVELRSAFERFAAWLLWLYKSIAGLNVKINDDIRAVFDRMLATEAEIAKAREVSGGDAALFSSAAEMGESEEVFRAYVRLREQADEEAKARLRLDIMEPIKREEERWYKEERARVRSEVEREVNAWGQYRAIEWMGNRRWLGEGQPQALPDMRLSKDILVDRYGDGILKTLPRGKQTIYAVEGGIDPDDAAAWFGFESGDEMIRAMETAPKRTDAIEAETDRRMRELHGDPLHDGSAEERAIAALHNDKRGQWIASELEAVRKTLDGAERLSLKQAREVARKTIAGMKVRDAMNWRRFLAAERKAAEEAAELGARLSSERYWENRAKFAKKDETGALVRPAGQNDMVARLYLAKRRQLLNHALYAESIRVAEEVAKAERFVAKLQSKKHREKIAGAGRRENAEVDYLAAIDELLQRYDFRKMSARAEDRRGALSAYVEAMRAAGRENELAIPQIVLEPGGALSRATRHEKAMRDAGRIPYKSVPVEELRGVIDALKNIEHAALRWNEFIVNQKKREFNEAAETIARSIIENVGSRPASWIKESGLGAMAKRGVSAYLATVQSATYIMRKLDGREDVGPVYELLKSDLDAAAYRELTLQRETADKLRKLFAMYSEDEQRQMAVSKVRPELGGRSFSKWNLIAMALNMGNEGNLARLTNERARFHLKPHEVEAVKSMLDERDARFVQGVWDLISSFRSEIAKRDRRVKGVEPEWVEPTPVTIGGVELRGGYYPIKYDPRHGGGRPSAAAGDDDILQSIMGGGYSSAHTKDGHLKARGTNVNQSLLLDVSVIPRHLNEVIHDLTHSEAVVNTWKLLTDSRVERAFLDAGLDHAYQQLKLWVQDAATGQVGSGSVLAQALTFLRGGFAYSKLAFSVKTMLMQPLGVMQSAVAVGKGRMARNMLRMIQHPVAYSNEVLEKSAMMRMRRDTFNKDLMDAAAQANIASPAGNRVKAFWDQYIIPLGMAGMVYTQFYTVDLPTWGAAYEKGMKQFGGDVEKSIQYADRTVQRSQGSGIWTDRTAIERGTLSGSIRQNPFVTLLTTLGSYFFAKANMAFESYDQFRSEGVTLHSSMRFGMDMGLLFLGEAIVVELVKELWDEAFGDDDDEDDGSFIGNVLTEGVKTAVAGLPVIRDAAGVIQGFDAGTYAAILKVFTSPAYQASQGEVDAAFVKSVINLAGMVGRMPSAQINRIVDASWRQAEGEDVSPMEYIMGRSR